MLLEIKHIKTEVLSLKISKLEVSTSPGLYDLVEATTDEVVQHVVDKFVADVSGKDRFPQQTPQKTP